MHFELKCSLRYLCNKFKLISITNHEGSHRSSIYKNVHMGYRKLTVGPEDQVSTLSQKSSLCMVVT